MKLILRLVRNGELVGEWPLEDELQVCLADPESGRVVADLQVRAPEPMDEQPIPPTATEELTVLREKPSLPSPIPARAEVWFKGKEGWVQKGILCGGQRARMGKALVRLENSGDLLVTASEDLSGFAFLPSGRRQPIAAESDRLRFPAGSSVTLESEAYAFYIRSDFVDRPLVEHSVSIPVESTQEIEPLTSDLN